MLEGVQVSLANQADTGHVEDEAPPSLARESQHLTQGPSQHVGIEDVTILTAVDARDAYAIQRLAYDGQVVLLRIDEHDFPGLGTVSLVEHPVLHETENPLTASRVNTAFRQTPLPWPPYPRRDRPAATGDGTRSLT